jgi:hypothetical protein
MVKQGALFKNYKEDTLRLAAKGFPKRRGGLDKGEVKLALLEVYEALRGEGEQKISPALLSLANNKCDIYFNIIIL